MILSSSNRPIAFLQSVGYYVDIKLLLLLKILEGYDKINLHIILHKLKED